MAAEQPEYDWNRLHGQADKEGHTDLTIGEIQGVLASILHASPQDIGAFMVVLKERCGNCGEAGCVGGPIRIMTSAGYDEDGQSDRLALLLSSGVVEAIATRFDDEES